MKRLAWFSAVGLGTVAAVWLLWEFRAALVLFILSLTIAAVIRPGVDRLHTLGLHRNLALFLIYFIFLALIPFLAVAFGGSLFSDIRQLSHDLPLGYQQIKASWLTGGMVQQAIARNAPDLDNLVQTLTGGQLSSLIQNSVGFTLISMDMIGKLVITIVMSIYWSADQEHFKRLWLSLLPTDWRTQARDIWEKIEKEIGSYLRSELIQSLLTFIVLGIGYQLIGLSYPILLALIGAIGWLIVWFGGIIAVIPGLVVGFSINPLTGIVATVFTIAVLAFLEFVVEPRLFDRRYISSLLVVIMVLLMVKQYGVVGFFIAPPLAACIQIIAGHLIHSTITTAKPIPPPPVIQMDILKERLSFLKSAISTRSEPPAPDILNLVDRLDGMIEQAYQDEQIAG